jgi:hypothetical protein
LDLCSSRGHLHRRRGSVIDESAALTGTVLTPDGKSLIGATVRLSALRNDASTTPRSDILIAETTTDRQGRFTVSIPATRPDLISLAKFHNGALNMEVAIQGVVPDPPDSASDARTANLVTQVEGLAVGATYSVYATALALSSVAVGTAEVGRGLALSSSNVGTLTAYQVVKQALATYARQGNCPYGTGYQKISDSYPQIPVGEFHAYEDTSGWFSYGKTSDSDLGVGYNSGGNGWQVNGSVHMGNSQSASIKLYRGPYWGKRINTVFHYVYERN